MSGWISSGRRRFATIAAGAALGGLLLVAPGQVVGACEAPPDLVAAAAGLADRAAPWVLPPAVATPLAACDSPAARSAIAAAGAVLEVVAETQAVLPQAGVRSGAVRKAFEGAVDLAALEAAATLAARQREAATVVADAVGRLAEPRPAVVALGIAPAKLEAEQVTGLAAVAAADLDAARAAAAFIAQELADEAEAARLVAAARDRVAASRGPLETLGLLGVTFDERLGLALATVQGINLPSAREITGSIHRDLDGAASAGATRLAAIGVIALVALVLVRLVRAARRSRGLPAG